MNYDNDELNKWAEAFAGYFGDPNVVCPDQLPWKDLDFSLASLKIVDAYLEYLHENEKPEATTEWDRTILGAGAYVGEVIRYSADRKYNWVRYEDFAAEDPELAELLGEKDFGISSFLITGRGKKYTITFPIQKVIKFILKGKEESTHFYASAECKSKR
jgi:hypothetical protein